MNPVMRQSRVQVKTGFNSTNGSGEVKARHPASADDAFSAAVTSAAGERHRQRVARLERLLLERALETLGNPPIRIVLWSGEAISSGSDAINATLRIHDRATLWRLIFDPEFQFGEAFVDRRVEVDGDLVEMLTAINRA